MKVLTVDIETWHPDFKPDPEDKRPFAPIAQHEPVVIVWLIAERSKDREGFELNVWRRDTSLDEVEDGDWSERDALVKLAGDIHAANRIVTWNGRRFDLPVLGLRALKHGVDWRAAGKLANRYTVVHLDMADMLGGRTGLRGIHMADVAHLLGMPGKTDIDGSQVPGLWLEGKNKVRERIVRYCIEDVVQEYGIYLHYCASHLGSNLQAVTEFWMRLQIWLEQKWGITLDGVKEI